MEQIFKSHSLQLSEVLILLKYRFLRTKNTHRPSEDFASRNLTGMDSLAVWEIAGPVSPYDAH